MKYFVYCRKSSEAEDRQVLSIESQLSTLRRTFAQHDIDIAGIYTESFSAKSPGRHLFNEMMARIEKGDAAGIVAWAPDRLARNSIDGGRLIYLLDRGVLKDLKFATYTFENNSQGKFMLQIMFGQSKYYSDALSDNVKRGNQTKIERGWRPNRAPLGYLNDAATKTIVEDPIHFPLIKKMFELVLQDGFTPKQVALIARDDWGFRTPKTKRSGGVPIALGTIYKILGNVFYAGVIEWNGQSFPGRHEPVVTIEQFREVRRRLQNPGARPHKHSFPFTGMIRCGSCDMSVTAEHKTNRFGSRYIYYHCSRRREGPRCKQPSLEARSLIRQIEGFLATLHVEPRIQLWALRELAISEEQSSEAKAAQQRSLKNSLDETRSQLTELTNLRLRRLISDEEFSERRQTLQAEELRLREGKACAGQAYEPLEPLDDLFLFRNKATKWFSQGDDRVKRQILKTVSSNLILEDRILSIEAAKPFSELRGFQNSQHLLGVVHEVRALLARQDAGMLDILDNIKQVKIALGLMKPDPLDWLRAA